MSEAFFTYKHIWHHRIVLFWLSITQDKIRHDIEMHTNKRWNDTMQLDKRIQQYNK